MPFNLADRFSVDEAAAAVWAQNIIDNDGVDPVTGEDVMIDADWDPIWDGESVVDLLVVVARNAGVLTHPDNAVEVLFDYSHDEDGGGYGWMVDFGMDLRVARYMQEYRKIVVSGTHGVDAVVSILTEAAECGNSLIRELNTFMLGNSPVPVEES